MPVHHRAAECADANLAAAGETGEPRSPLLRATLARTGTLTSRPLTENAALRIVKRRAAAAGLPPEICCHTFRATGITSYLRNGGELNKAQAIANHESPQDFDPERGAMLPWLTVEMAPTIRSEITAGQVLLTGHFNEADCRALATGLTGE